MPVSTRMFKCASISLLKYELLANDFGPKQKKKVKFLYIFYLENENPYIYTSHFIPNLDEQKKVYYPFYVTTILWIS